MNSFEPRRTPARDIHPVAGCWPRLQERAHGSWYRLSGRLFLGCDYLRVPEWIGADLSLPICLWPKDAWQQRAVVSCVSPGGPEP